MGGDSDQLVDNLELCGSPQSELGPGRAEKHQPTLKLNQYIVIYHEAEI